MMKLVLLVLVIAGLGEAAKRPKIIRMRQLYIRIHEVGLCKDNPPDSGLENVTIRMDGATCSVSAVSHFNRTIAHIEKMIIIIRQCNDAAEEINCEHFQTWRFGKETCNIIEQKHAIWTSFVEAHVPKLACPISKGTYQVNNATLDFRLLFKAFNGFPLEKHFWRIRTEIHDYRMAICFNFALRFLRGKEPINN